MNNVIHTRTRMGVLRGWERFAIKRGSFFVAAVAIALLTSALITFLPVHIG